MAKYLVNLTLCGVLEHDGSTESLEFILTQNSNPGLLLGALLSQMKQWGDSFDPWADQPGARIKIAPAANGHVAELGVMEIGNVDVAVADADSECADPQCPWKPLGTGF